MFKLGRQRGAEERAQLSLAVDAGQIDQESTAGDIDSTGAIETEGRTQRIARKIKLDGFGLLDPTVFAEYTGECLCHLHDKPRNPETHFMQIHHGYFPEPLFKETKRPEPVKLLRASHYNHFEILTCQEDLYHLDHEEDPFPIDGIDVESAEWFHKEAGWLDDYIATSTGVETVRKIVESPFRRIPPEEVSRMNAIAHMLEDIRYEALYRVGKIEVIHPQVVTGALEKHLTGLRDMTTAGLVEERLALNPVIIPTRPRNQSHYSNRARRLIEYRVAHSSLAVRKTVGVVPDLSFLNPDSS